MIKCFSNQKKEVDENLEELKTRDIHSKKETEASRTC
jgi:hypothetical protein